MNALTDLLYRFGGLFRWWVVVAPWEEAVRVRLGKHMAVLGPGVHLRIPAADRVFRQSVRRRFSSVPTQAVTTRDRHAVTISGALCYRIADIAKLYDSVHDAEDTIQTEAAALVARYVRDLDLADLQPAALEAAVTASLDLGRYGLADGEFALTDFVAVRTYRLIQSYPKDYRNGGDSGALATDREEGAKP